MLADEVFAHNRRWPGLQKEETFQLRAYKVHIDKSEGYISWVENQPIIRDRFRLLLMQDPNPQLESGACPAGGWVET